MTKSKTTSVVPVREFYKDHPGFGMAMTKPEGHTQNYETGETHPTTDAERAAAALDTSTYMEICVDPKKQSREDIHRQVDRWLDNYEKGER